MWRPGAWPVVVCLNLAVLGTAVGVGWRHAVRTGARVAADQGRVGPRVQRPPALGVEARRLTVANAAAVARVVVLGACSAGVYGFSVLAVNGYGLGFALAATAAGVPAALPLVLRYAIVEFAVLLLASAAAQRLTIAGCHWVRGRPMAGVPGVLGAIAVALLLLPVGAWLEADAVRRAGLGEARE